MQTIQIDVKDVYVDKVLTMLDSLRNIMIESVDVVTEEQAWQRDKKRLQNTLDDYKANGSKHFTPNDKPYWDTVRSRLMERHTGHKNVDRVQPYSVTLSILKTPIASVTVAAMMEIAPTRTR